MALRLKRQLQLWLLGLLGLLLAMGSLTGPALSLDRSSAPSSNGSPELQVFVRPGCPHCAQAKAFLPALQRQRPELVVRIRSIDTDPAALADLTRYSQQAGVQTPGVPTFVIDGQVLVGFDSPQGRGQELLALVSRDQPRLEPLRLGPFGELDVGRLGLPLFTLAMGLLDGFNPCAMWVLLFLLSLLVHWHDRRRMALVAGTFVLVSGAVYFAFMAAWLNVFLLLGWSTWLRLTLAGLALVVGMVNLLEIRREGPNFSLSIPASAKPGIYARMRGVIQRQTLLPALAAVAALAVVVNLVELLCTAGLPALYTAVLAQQNLPAAAHYGYLGLYILGYIADDSLMVGLAVVALSSNKLTERTGRLLKLISGVVMVALALVLLLRPGWLL
ncbi:glutaredoxin family protein [Synechococcus sp. CCY9202]|uniref:glutaredoxin family protein n=1 Tax=Synechococcus sp. CCY9202 TaxID=174698 RepID=UPI002B217645|nr:glutaredoxin family protein [Synechococcus sp. CCY9202]MEA5423165.1 glutaredoxin family protein [Synechococcus sp. CCY9202]